MGISPRLLLVALGLLVLPALVTALFLARNAHWAVAPGAQPGGTIRGRLAPVDDVPTGAAIAEVPPAGVVPAGVVPAGVTLAGVTLAGVSVEIVGVARDGHTRSHARGVTDAEGRFELPVEAVDGHYEVRVTGGGWQDAAVQATLIDADEREVLVHVRPAASLAITFTRRSGGLVRGGEWTLESERPRSWFSAFVGRTPARKGSFRDPKLVVEGLPPTRVHLHVLFDGGDRTEIVIDLAAGPNHSTIEL